MKKFYSAGTFAKMLGVHVRTVQRWDNEGLVKAYKSQKDHRFYTEEQYEMIAGTKWQGSGDIVEHKMGVEVTEEEMEELKEND